MENNFKWVYSYKIYNEEHWLDKLDPVETNDVGKLVQAGEVEFIIVWLLQKIVILPTKYMYLKTW